VNIPSAQHGLGQATPPRQRQFAQAFAKLLAGDMPIAIGIALAMRLPDRVVQSLMNKLEGVRRVSVDDNGWRLL
jgi:hypothetical protein